MTSTDTAMQVVMVPENEASGLPWAPFSGMKGVHIKELHSSPECVAGLMRLEPGAHEVRHSHRAGQHHMYVLDGWVDVDGTRLGAGSYVHVPPGARHTMRSAGPHGCTLLFVYARAM